MQAALKEDAAALVPFEEARKSFERDEPFYREVAARMRAERRRQKLDSRLVARECGMSDSHYSNMERGTYRITLLQLVRVADALAVPIHELIPTVQHP